MLQVKLHSCSTRLVIDDRWLVSDLLSHRRDTRCTMYSIMKREYNTLHTFMIEMVALWCIECEVYSLMYITLA